MRNIIIKLTSPIRKLIAKCVLQKDKYFIPGTPERVKPISTKYGFDRGTPIDRVYIEDFLQKNKYFVTGVCMEVTDNSYTKKYGVNIKRIDVIDIDKNNKKANIHADLANMPRVLANTYDCIILTQVLGVVKDYDSAIKECYRVLKPGGVLLTTVSALSPLWFPESTYWRFNPEGIKIALDKHFKKNSTLAVYGNLYACQSFLAGFAAEELTKEELDYKDEHYPLIIGTISKK